MSEPCSHPITELKNFRGPPDGDADSGGELGLLADCGQCGGTTLIRVNVIEKLPWH